MLSGAPLDMHVEVPEKRERKTNPDAPKEWRLQAACIKEVHALMKIDKNLWYEVNLVEGHRDPVRANVAKMMGMQQGPNDLTLYRRKLRQFIIPEAYFLRTHRVEFKLPGKNLTPEQEAWFDFHRSCGIPCDRVDDIRVFVKILDAFCSG